MDKTTFPILSFILLLSYSVSPTNIWGHAVLTCVGVMWLMSSDASCFRRVVLPALSKPRRRSLTSWSGALFNLRKIESKPLNNHKKDYFWGTNFHIIEHQSTFSLKKVLEKSNVDSLLFFPALMPFVSFAFPF